jgi:MFS family permease
MGIAVNARTAFSLLFPVILDEFGWSRAATAATFTTGLLASNLFTPWQLHLTFGVLVAGASVLVSYMGHSLLLPNWFVRRRGLALGVAFSGVGVGSFLLLPWLETLIGRAGWRSACWALAALIAVVLVPLNAVVPRRRPEELGLAPDGGAGPARHPAAARGHGDGVVDAAWTAVEWTLGRAIRTGRFWWIFLGYFTGLFAWYAVQVHQTKYLLELGFSPRLAAYALGLVGLTGVVGQIAWGHVSDRASVFGAIPVELFQGARYGSIFAVLNLASNAGAGSGPWVAGWVHDRTGSYAPAFGLAIACAAVSVAAMWLAAGMTDPAALLGAARRELARFPALLDLLLADLDPETWRRRPAPDEWAPVAHDRLRLRQLAGAVARLWVDRWSPLRGGYAGPIPHAPGAPGEA